MSTFDRHGRALGARLHEPAKHSTGRHGFRLRARLSLVTLLSCSAMQTGAWAQGTASIYEEQEKLVRSDGQVTPLKGNLFGDSVSLYSGALEFVNADFAIPGNNALPVGVARRHVTGQHRVPAETSVTTGIFGDWDIEIPRMSGVFAAGAANQGWAVPNSGANVYRRCTFFGSPPDGRPAKGLSIWEASEFWSGNSLYVPGQGAQEVLLRAAQNPYKPSDGRSWPLVTKNGWQFGCLPTLANGTTFGNKQGEGFLALAPDGTQYRFDWMAERSMPSLLKKALDYPGTDRLFRAEVWLMPTLITDRFGNTVTLTYDAASPWRLTSISSSDVRSVSFGYLAGTSLVSTASDGQRTWNYTYTGTRLSQVALPDGSRWLYDLAALAIAPKYQSDHEPNCEYSGQVVSAPAVGDIIHPSGARGRFATESRIHARSKVPRTCQSYDGSASSYYSLYPRFFANRSITSKTLFGPGLGAAGLRTDYSYSAANGSWSTCTTCSETKTVEVTDPRGHRTRHTFGTRFGVNDGQLLQQDEGWNGSTAMRSTVNRYRATDAGPFPSWIGDSDQMRNDALQAELHTPLDRKLVTQQGVTFTWLANTFDIRARATSVTRSSSLGHSRTETTAYHDHTGKWVLGQVASVTELGTGLAMESHSYDAATANRSASYSFGLLQQRFAYNGDGTLLAHYDPLGRATIYGNYRRGLAQVVSYPDGSTQSATVNHHGAITSLTNGAGTTTTFGYDAMGRLSMVAYPGGDAVTYHPTTIQFERTTSADAGLEAGHWRQTVAMGNARTVRHFDALWRPRLIRSWDVTNEAGTRRVVQPRWDVDGRKTFESTPQRDIATVDTSVAGTAWAHDALGRVFRQYQDSELGLLTTSTDYLSGFVRRTTTPRGHATSTSFQAFDTPSDEALTNIAAPEGVTVSIARDVFGKPQSITRAGGGASVTRAYVYDGYQRLCKTLEPETGATVQAYDGAGHITWRASGLALPSMTSCDQSSVPAARMISHGYDARGRLTSTAYGDGSAGIDRSYTADGLPLQVWSAGSVWTYGYNNRRKLTSEVLSLAGTSFAMHWGIDAHGHVSSLIYPDGAAVAYSPNALGQATQVSGYASAVTHHPNGAVAAYTLANGVAHSVVQNIRGLPQMWRDAGVVQDLYAYDANGNVTAITDQQEGASSRSLGYDALDRLTSANGVWGTGSYTYDALDNLRASTVGARLLSHNIDAATNRLNSLTGSLSIGLAYDANGNLTQRGAQTFAFDIGNRLQSATGKASYIYDGHGRRIRALYADGSWKLQVYSHAGKLLYAQHSAQGSTRHVYLGDRLIAETSSASGSTAYSHTDALGSPVARTSSSGGLLSRTRYEPYGATAAGTNPMGIGFTGHVNDADTGLVYMQQRYYDAVAGRFLAVDPVTADLKTGRSFNRYTYAENNPYRYTDPDGRDTNPVTGESRILDRDLRTNSSNPSVGKFGFTRSPNNWNKGFHGGVDIRAPVGTDLKAPISGVVTVIKDFEGSREGNMITITGTSYGQQVSASMMHLSVVGITSGAKISEGQVVGKSGDSGNAKGLPSEEAHVHMSIKADGKTVDPQAHFNRQRENY